MYMSLPVKQMFLDSSKFYWPVVKRSASVLIPLYIGCEALHHYYTYMSQLTQHMQSFNIMTSIGQLLTSLLEFVVLAMLIPQRVMEIEDNREPGSFWAFAKKHVLPLTIEGLRVVAVTALWSLLLIIPGIFKYLRYSFVQYVVVADPEYQKGERDALSYSNMLVKGITIELLIIILLLFGIEMLRSSFRLTYPITDVPLEAFFSSIAFFFITIYSNILLFRLYQLRVVALVKGAQNGANV
ncbi:MAG: hypothetical protein A2Z20_06185 [Bdellovibrionales bacterium RBG_16_40_8]|nr:MAG: hypothetical protein A2Z20_06185 [Bdellovibrionales bacterium RBG_16_40_8]